MEIEVVGPRKIITFMVGGREIAISETLVTGWIVIIVLTLLILWLTHDLKVVPETKRQAAAEWIVNFFEKTVSDTMGPKMTYYAPYLATIFCFALFGALLSLFGLRSMTVDINCTGTWALMTFVLITYWKIRNNGFGGYLKGFTEPVAVITPINILSEVATPISMAIRMFGNMAGGMIITSLIYAALTLASNAVYGLIGISLEHFKIFQIGIPALFSIYFDLFSGVVQSYVFIMLTMAYVGDAANPEKE
ncbi:MAG: F0F1 ATP synthase subunit A [Oscillospiraceae bacterium]|nr:F0F1 ATP synthase subunit A [Oscillospiraceae bacterium]